MDPHPPFHSTTTPLTPYNVPPSTTNTTRIIPHYPAAPLNIPTTIHHYITFLPYLSLNPFHTHRGLHSPHPTSEIPLRLEPDVCELRFRRSSDVLLPPLLPTSQTTLSPIRALTNCAGWHRILYHSLSITSSECIALGIAHF